MNSYVWESQPLFLKSDAQLSDNVQISSNGGEINTYINNLTIPSSAKKCFVYLQSARFWYTFPNISASKGNNKFYFTNDVANPTKYSITIDDGLYSVQTLNNTIKNALVNLGLSSTAIELSGNDSTGKTFFALESGYQLYFPSDSMRVLLGFNLNQKVPASGLTTGAYGEYSPNIADFSDLSSVMIHSSLVSRSIVNGVSSDVIASIAPSVSVGSQQSYSPQHLIKVNADNLIGQNVRNVRTYLTNQMNQILDTNGEKFEVDIVIEFLMPVSN